MKIRIISIECGLGNQMFQYAFYLSIKKKAIGTFFLVAANENHNGFELDKIFFIKYNRLVNIFVKLVKKFFIHNSSRMYEKNFGSYDESVFSYEGHVIYYCGYWQSERYFQTVKKDVKEKFSFIENKISIKNKEFINKIENMDTVSIHVRRGDYESHDGSKEMLGGLCDLSYYTKAIERIKFYTGDNAVFIIFSDDMVWTRSNLHLENSIYVDWNTDIDNWQDMLLMTKCKHHIIANSSFSWWGAYLNENPDKKVIYPKRWFNKHLASDIAPSDWIKI